VRVAGGVRSGSVDEKVLEEIRFQQEVVDKDTESPLYLIRQKELEISGRVLAARSQAEKIVADARKKAQAILRDAEAEADRQVKRHTEEVLAAAEREAAEIRASIPEQTAALKAKLEPKIDEAVEFVVRAVTSV
jgi:vacuolar-type H+-ATPase subunit H